MTHDGAVRSAAATCGAVLIVAALTVGDARAGVDAIEATASLFMFASSVAVLCAAVFFYVHWHIAQDRAMAWLVTATAAFALQELSWLMRISGDDVTGLAQSTWAALFQIAVTVALVTMVVSGDRLPARFDPLAVGMLLGLALILTRLALLELPLPAPSAVVSVAAFAGLGAVGIWTAVRILRAHVLAPDLRHRIAIAAVFLAIGQGSAMAAATPPSLLFVGALSNAVGAAMLLATAAGRARFAILDEASALRILRGQLEVAEQGLHTDQARLHEIRSTLAGIATATELLHRAEISVARREQLHDMLAAELRRLDRLVDDRSLIAPGPTELDLALRPVVVRHEADGLPIRWRPSGHVVIARPDDVAEIVNVLLSNARRHAGGPVRLEAGMVGDDVEVSVADSGPGVDPEVRPRLFTWGTRSSGSPGEGVGLATARLLAEQLGGHLDLDPAPDAGARFVLSLKAAPLSAAQDSHR